MNQKELNNATLSGYYIDSNNGQRAYNSTNESYNVSTENFRGYKTYYVDVNSPDSTATRSDSVDSSYDYYVTEANAKHDIDFRATTPNTKKKRDRSTIYDEDNYALARESSSYDYDTTSSPANDKHTSAIAGKSTNNFFQTNKCLCFTTLWLIIISATNGFIY